MPTLSEVEGGICSSRVAKSIARIKDSASRGSRRDGRVAEGARLESVFTRKGNVGSNPTLSARFNASHRFDLPAYRPQIEPLADR
jgi:hypothetical protein